MIPERFQSKRIVFEELCRIIQPGNRIFISSGPAAPLKTMADIMASEHPNLADLEILQMVTIGDLLSPEKVSPHKFRFKTFCMRDHATSNIHYKDIDVIPSHLIEIPHLFATRAIGIDVAIIQASPPDEKGFMNLGIVMDVADIIIQTASVVVIEINPNVPKTFGETAIHVNQVHHLIESDLPLIESKTRPFDYVLDKIGWQISNLIENEATVALHHGILFDALAAHLKAKTGLRILSHVVSDWVIDLMESGALALERGIHHLGPVTTSSCFGSRRLYDYVHQNPLFEFMPILRLSYQTTVPQIPKMVSILNVKKIDLFGDSVLLNADDVHLSGFDAKLNIAIGTAASRKGKIIAAVRSIDKNGNSNIVLSHAGPSARIRSTMGLVRHVVTEFGVANVFGKSIRERILAILDITHPDHRRELFEQAKEAGYLYPDQIYTLEKTVHYPYELETVKSFHWTEDRLEIKFRPIRPSDEDMMRRLFYQFSEESKYLRYFSPVRTMPHRKIQTYVNIDYQKTVSIVGVVQRDGGEQIIAEARYAFDPSQDAYDLAFVVDEAFQNKGIAAFLFDYLVRIARERAIKTLCAIVLPENLKMCNLFDKNKVYNTKNETEDGFVYRFFLDPKDAPFDFFKGGNII